MESDCLFCQIIQGRKPADVVFRSGSVVAFKDIHPHAPTHILIVPVKHIRSVNDLTEKDRPIMADLFMTARMLAASLVSPSRDTNCFSMWNVAVDRLFFTSTCICWEAGNPESACHESRFNAFQFLLYLSD